MALYPKQPFGPSASGAAGVRALESVGGAWQRKNGAGYSARLMGDFSRITTSGFEYLTDGRLSDTSGRVAFAGFKYQITFLPGFGRPLEHDAGRGGYFGVGGYVPDPTQHGNQLSYEYPAPSGLADLALFNRYKRAAEAYFGNFYGGRNYRGEVPYEQTRLQMSDESLSLVPYAAFVGDGPDGRVGVFATTILNGRFDVAGRELEDPAICVFPEGASGTINPINPLAFTRQRAEFFPHLKTIATEDHFAVFMLEKFFYTELAANNAGKQPKFWMVRAAGKDMGALSVFDLTTTVFNGARVPDPILFGGVFTGYRSSTGMFNNALNSYSMAFMQTVALPNNTLLLAFYLHHVGTVPSGALGLIPDAEWHVRIAKVTLAPTVTASIVFDRIVGSSPNLGLTLFFPAERIQDIVHLGAGRVLARIVKGLGQPFVNNSTPIDAPRTPGDWPVTFLRSEDSGSTWAEFTPTGFDATLQNKHFGDFRVHRPRTAPADASDGIVLCTSWNSANQAYHVYESKDDGSTWTRKGTVTKPKTFQRIDTDFAGDGGGNFQLLLPGPDTSRPADITIPGRFLPQTP